MIDLRDARMSQYEKKNDVDNRSMAALVTYQE